MRQSRFIVEFGIINVVVEVGNVRKEPLTDIVMFQVTNESQVIKLKVTVV